MRDRTSQRLFNSTGQALIETVLVTIISVSMITFFVATAYKPMGKFFTNYLGDYLGCLLDSGELPAKGSYGGGGASASVCDAQFQPFTVAQGRPPLNNGGSGSNFMSNSNSRGSSGAGAGKSAQSGAGDSQSSGGASGNSSSSRSGGPKFIERSQAAADSASAEGASVVGSLSGARTAGNFRPTGPNLITANDRNRDQVTPYVGIPGWLNEQDKNAIGQRRAREESRLISQQENPDNEKNEKIKMNPQIRKVAAETDEEIRWSFGQLLKWGFVIALVLFIAFIVGTQLRQISAGMEKRDD